MVGPHEIELHLFVVLGLEKAVVETPLEEGTAVVPIPVVDKNVDAVIGSRPDLHLHDVGIGLVDVAPQRLARPGVSVVFCLGALDALSLTHALGSEHSRARLVTRVRGADIGGKIVGFHRDLRFVN